MNPVILSENDESLKKDNKLIGNLVAKCASTYLHATNVYRKDNDLSAKPERYDPKNYPKKHKSEKWLWVYSTINLFSGISERNRGRILDEYGRCRLDCSSFVGLALRGIPFEKTIYKSVAGKTGIMSRKYRDYDPNDYYDFTKGCFKSAGEYGWEFSKFDLFPDNDEYKSRGYNNIGLSRGGKSFRTLRNAASEAEFFLRNGLVLFDEQSMPDAVEWHMTNPAVENHKEEGYYTLNGKRLDDAVQPGDLIFWAKATSTEAQKKRFRSVSHVGIFAEAKGKYYHFTSYPGCVEYPEEKLKTGSVFYSDINTPDGMDEVILIIRPAYRYRCFDKKPTGVNLYSYPPSWGTGYDCVYTANKSEPEYYISRRLVDGEYSRISFNGVTKCGNSTILGLKIDRDVIKLIPGEYTVSFEKISGSVCRGGDENGYAGPGFSLHVKKSDGSNLIPENGEEKVRAFFGHSVNFKIEEETEVSLFIYIGKGSERAQKGYSFNDCIVEPSLVLNEKSN